MAKLQRLQDEIGRLQKVLAEKNKRIAELELELKRLKEIK